MSNTSDETTIPTDRLNALLRLEVAVLARLHAEQRCTSIQEWRRLQSEEDEAARACEKGSK
jgi:hypothetical protein